MSIICLVLAIIAPFVYDDQKKAAEGNDGKSKDAVQAEIDAAKAAMLTKPSKFVVFLVMFYAFLCMAIMYGAQQYTKAFGLAYCGLSEMQAASMTTMYQVGSIVAVAFWAVMMSKLKWHPLKVLIVDAVITAGSLLAVLLVHQVAIVYIAILILGFGCAGGALQTGLSVLQEFVPGPKGRNTGIYYTFMGAASYLMPVIVAKLTVISGESKAVYINDSYVYLSSSSGSSNTVPHLKIQEGIWNYSISKSEIKFKINSDFKVIILNPCEVVLILNSYGNLDDYN